MNKLLLSIRTVSVLFLLSIIILTGCNEKKDKNDSPDLYSGFQNPPPEARPFVRWWWNGNRITADEIDRELDILKDAGFGGVEINPIAFPEGSKEIGVEPKIWMSDEWIELVVHACKKVANNDMIADIIVGSGWPFGGEFLKEEQIIQRVVQHQILLEDSRQISETIESLQNEIEKESKNMHHPVYFKDQYEHELLYVQLIPFYLENAEDIIELVNEVKKTGRLKYTLPDDGKYVLSYGFVQKGHREVMHGSPGAAGPVMDHYKREVTLAYLSRLKEISEKSGIPLNELLRALFCDSIELAGSNWTDNFSNIFFNTYGYRLEPFLSFVFASESETILGPSDNKELQDLIRRARYDFNRLLVDLFLNNFTRTFQEFCTENELLCRYQAYGTPYLMGMLEGYMIPDIPESNNWIYSAPMDAPGWTWNQAHGYMIWNMYAAAGGHLTGRKIISCESMTNTRGVFKTSLEEIKQHDDMNFITGMNHAVLHGFNYSPPEAGFPGWIRYGAYFSEQNPWWPYIHNWVDYNARLSYVFQNTQAVKSIAILGPTSDLWSETGLTRIEFHTQPEYLYKIWEPLSQLGYSCEYLNERVIQNSNFKNGNIQYGNMSYKALVLANIRSMHPETALSIRKFMESGGKLVIVDDLPGRSLHLKGHEENDRKVQQVFEALLDNYSSSVIRVKSPANMNHLMRWTDDFLQRMDLEPDVWISQPNKDVYQIHQTSDDKMIYFFTNVNRRDSAEFAAKFPVEDKIPYIWDPETGTREVFPYGSEPEIIDIGLPPLKSMLIVYEKGNEKSGKAPEESSYLKKSEIDDIWIVTGEHVNGEIYSWEFNELKDISLAEDRTLNTFAGKLIYETNFQNKGNICHLDLGEINEGVTEVYINGEKAGFTWYGNAFYHIEPYLKNGSNELVIHCTTVLANYCTSLDDPVARKWANYDEKLPLGIEGPVILLGEE